LVSHARTLCDWFGIQSSGAALFGAPVGFAVTILVSLITPRPGSEMASLVDEMRRAKGPEILPLEPTQDP
jgi:cation/acetate symporter